jgi:hypothetical protein
MPRFLQIYAFTTNYQIFLAHYMCTDLTLLKQHLRSDFWNRRAQISSGRPSIPTAQYYSTFQSLQETVSKSDLESSFSHPSQSILFTHPLIRRRTVGVAEGIINIPCCENRSKINQNLSPTELTPAAPERSCIILARGGWYAW